MNEEWLKNLEENIEDFPEEVRDFIFGEGLRKVKEELAKQVDTEEQKKQLSNMLMFFLLQGKTEKELDEFIGTLAISEDQKLAIRAIIQIKVISELIDIIEVNKELESETGISYDPEKPAKTNSLTSLADRLKQASIASPAKREYGLNKTEAVTERPAIDPYHEAIDNE